MTAVIVGGLFGLAIAAAGRPVARWMSPDRPPAALGAALALAALVVVATDVAAALRFEPWLVVGLWSMLAASGLVVTAVSPARNPPRLGDASISPRSGVLALTMVAAAFPLLLLPVPLDTDAQGFGLLALAIREGRTIDTLAPWRPDIGYLYSPGALLIFATVSNVLRGLMVPTIMMGVGHACLVLAVWLAWELGGELAPAGAPSGSPGAGRDAWPWAASVSAASSVGLWTALLDAHYTAVIGLLLTLACLTSFFRFQRTGGPRDLFATTLALAAVVAAHQDTAIVLALGLGAFLLVGWIASDRPLRKRCAIGVAIPALGALILLAPWLYRVWPFVEAGMRSPFEVSPAHVRQLLLYHGLFWPLLALIGAVVSIRHRRWWAVAMIGWLLLIVEFSVLGLSERLVPTIAEPLVRFSYPFSLAWHGPIVPYITLGTAALVGLMARGRLSPPTLKPGALVSSTVILLLGVVFSDRLLEASRSVVPVHGAFASANDLRAMRWIRDNTAPDARVLNYPGDYEALRDWESHWAPVVAERDCVYFRMQPFYVERSADERSGHHGLHAAYREQRALLAFWRDPLDAAQPSRLRQSGVDYVLVPESIGDPNSMTHAWRWQPPARLAGEQPIPGDAPYLRLAYTAGGARVFEVVGSGDETSGDTGMGNRGTGEARAR